MKKSLCSLVALILCFAVGVSYAASYTLPEKMYNQIAIGSGMKGSFHIAVKGDDFASELLKEIADADFSIRGIFSGKDFHYYVFQTDATEQQYGLSEIYRKDGRYYFRSDMVPDTVLAFAGTEEYIKKYLPSNGENPLPVDLIASLLTIQGSETGEHWEPILLRYQNELEMWLADFTVQAETVRMDNGFSALDFSYEIPIDSIYERIVFLFGEFSNDQDILALVNSSMTEEEKALYLNPNLLYYYQEVLKSLDIEKPVRMSKRVSAMGDVLSFKLQLPLDEKTTGYSSLNVENINDETIYTLIKPGEAIVLGMPSSLDKKAPSYERVYRLTHIKTDAKPEEKSNFSLKTKIRKDNQTYSDEDEKSHEIEHYSIQIEQTFEYFPEGFDKELIKPFDTVTIEADLHYSSKYAQNSATTLNITADIQKKDTSIRFEGVLKTAAPWLFMPFDISNAVKTGTETDLVLAGYLADWISNAHSMIRHNDVQQEIPAVETIEPVNEKETAETEDKQPADHTDKQESEAVPMEETKAE